MLRLYFVWTSAIRDLASRALMARIIATEQPDLIAFTGDLIFSAECDNPLQAMCDAVSVAEDSGVPWAAALGNHDSEGDVSRDALIETLLAHWFCVARRSPRGVSGVGNHHLEVLDQREEVAAALYFPDSGNESPLSHVGGYDWSRRDQIQWYVTQSRAFAARNRGQPVCALAFFHIPLPEYRDLWEDGVCYGHKFEAECCPCLNSGLFAAMVEQGDVIGTFVGHDHLNDYWGLRHGIRLCYGRATGYNTYGREGFARRTHSPVETGRAPVHVLVAPGRRLGRSETTGTLLCRPTRATSGSILTAVLDTCTCNIDAFDAQHYVGIPTTAGQYTRHWRRIAYAIATLLGVYVSTLRHNHWWLLPSANVLPIRVPSAVGNG